jgi:hypothetical protein
MHSKGTELLTIHENKKKMEVDFTFFGCTSLNIEVDRRIT